MKLLLALSIVLGAGGSVSAAESTFQNSCSDIKLAADGTTITAQCKKQNGTPIPASYTLQGVHNLDGKLSMGEGASTYQQSCDTVRLQHNAKMARLTAICKTQNGRPSNTQLPLTDINNVDGVLKRGT